MSGQLYAVGVGPGDPELLTLKAARLISSADVVAYFAGPKGKSNARAIAASQFPAEVIEELLQYPVTTQTTDHPGGYYGAMDDFYDEAAARLATHLDAGRQVVVISEGDPLFYSTYMYLHDRLAERYICTIVPGVTSVAGSTAAIPAPLARHEDVITILPGTLPTEELAWRLAQTQSAVIMKLGRTFESVREALHQAGRLDDAWYVERATMGEQRVAKVSEVDPDSVPYFSQIIVPGVDRRADAAGRHAPDTGSGNVSTPPSSSLNERPETLVERAARVETPATVYVVGLGPGPAKWLTPEASGVLNQVAHVFGYAPYVDRVPQRAGLTRHPSGNTVEVDRAREALELALAGESVAVVSGGDAGIFGMAAAVFEAAEDERYSKINIQVVPGVTAAQAASALAGAPLGADFCLISLSDRLKPWEVLANRLRKAAEADLCIALYNPRSRTRPEQLGKAKEILAEVRSPGTVVVIGRDVGRAEESLTVTTLGEFDPERVDMKCLVIIGAESTRVTPSGRVWTPRFVRQSSPI